MKSPRRLEPRIKAEVCGSLYSHIVMNSQSFNDFTLSVNTSVHQFLNHLITWRGTIAATLSTYIKITCGVWVVDSFIFFVVSPASKIVLYGRQRKWFCIWNIFLTKWFYPPRIKIGNAGNVYLKNAQHIYNKQMKSRQKLQ